MSFRHLTIFAAAVLLISSAAVVAADPAATPGTTAAGAVASPSAPASPATSPAPAAVDKWGISHAEPRTVSIGSLDRGSGYLFRAELTSKGAAIQSLKLANYFVTVKDLQLHKKLGNETAYQEAVAKDPAKYMGHYEVLGPVVTPQRQDNGYKELTFLPMATRKLTISLPDGRSVDINLDDQWNIDGGVKSDDKSQSVTFSITVSHDTGKGWQDFVKVVKTYTIQRDSYSVGVSLKVLNLQAAPVKLTLDQLGPTGLPEIPHQRGPTRYTYAGILETDAVVVRRPPDDVDVNNIPRGERIDVGTSDSKEPIVWIGQTNKYFGSMLYLEPRTKGRLQALEDKARFYREVEGDSPTTNNYLTGLVLPDIELKGGVAGEARAGSTEEIKFDLFAGPKDRDTLEGNPPGKDLYRELNYMGTVETAGSCAWCTWNWLIFGMEWLLETLYKSIAFHNYGVAIILLVVLVRLCLHPLTKKSQVSMMKMQKMGPAIAKLKEKYANDQETLQREMMKVYKEQGAGPLMGCLPMFLQMPIWIALWTSLSVSVSLRHAAFLPFWITDLSAPDAVISWPTVNIPLVGEVYSLNLLPILLTIATVLQAKLTPSSAPAASPEAKQQQKMMMYMLPGMMLLFFYTAPSGLTLYIMASTFAGVVEQYVIRKHIREREALAAKQEVQIEVPGRGPRGSRPKKPKGPFWHKQG